MARSSLHRGQGQEMLAATTKAPSQRDRILALLQERGTEGALNTELNHIGFRYGARIWELRKMGHRIDKKQESESVFRFIWKGQDTSPRQESLFRPAANRRGRPRVHVDRNEVLRWRAQGASWRQVARFLGAGVETCRRAVQACPKNVSKSFQEASRTQTVHTGG